MRVDKRFWPVLAMTALFSLPAYAADWVISRAGGSVIEMPSSFHNGLTRAVIIDGQNAGVAYEPNSTISLRQFRVATRSRPFGYLGIKFGLAEINYSVDEVSRGIVSGNDRRGGNFYAMCRREPGALVCIELRYDADYQSDYAPIIDRITQSFDYLDAR